MNAFGVSGGKTLTHVWENPSRTCLPDYNSPSWTRASALSARRWMSSPPALLRRLRVETAHCSELFRLWWRKPLPLAGRKNREAIFQTTRRNVASTCSAVEQQMREQQEQLPSSVGARTGSFRSVPRSDSLSAKRMADL